MKLVKNFVFAVLLASILAVSAPAGELDTPGMATPTPTPTPEHILGTSEEGTISYNADPDAAGVTVETSDYLLYEALAALLSVY